MFSAVLLHFIQEDVLNWASLTVTVRRNKPDTEINFSELNFGYSSILFSAYYMAKPNLEVYTASCNAANGKFRRQEEPTLNSKLCVNIKLKYVTNKIKISFIILSANNSFTHSKHVHSSYFRQTGPRVYESSSKQLTKFKPVTWKRTSDETTNVWLIVCNSTKSNKTKCWDHSTFASPINIQTSNENQTN